jgi:hypothetical protein
LPIQIIWAVCIIIKSKERSMKEEDSNSTTPQPTVDPQKIADTFAPIKTSSRPSSDINTHTTSFDPKVKKTKRRIRPKTIVLSAGFTALVLILGIYGFNMANRSESSPGNEIRSVFSDNQMREYNSPQNKFTINLPGFPEIQERTYQDGEKEIKMTSYERRVENNSKLYTFEVHDYSGLNLDEKKALEVKLNSTIQNTPGARLGNSQMGVYNGLNAIQANYTVTENDKTYDSHLRFVMKDSKIYAIILVGDNEDKFEEFANSLRLG